MDRRRFLTDLAVGSGAVLAGVPLLTTATSGCGGAVLPPMMGRAETDALLARMDRGLAAIHDVPEGAIAEQLQSHPQPVAAERLLRLGIETFVVSDVAAAIPRGVRVPESFTARLAPELARVETYASTHHALLSRMKAPARRRLDARMRAEPTLGMDVAGWMDDHAKKIGVSGESRFRLRTGAMSMATRMRRQSAGAVIDDSVAKVEMVAARNGMSLALERSIVSAAMIDAIWQQVQDGVAPPDGAPPSGVIPPAPGGIPPAPGAPPSAYGAPPAGPSAEELTAPAQAGAIPPPRTPATRYPLLPPGAYAAAAAESATHGPFAGGRRWNNHWDRPGDEEIQIGAIMIGLICPFGVLTLGLLTVIGVIVLVAGCVQNSDWNGESEAERRIREAR